MILYNLSGKTRKKLGVPKGRKIQKCVLEKPNSPLQWGKHKKRTLDMNPCSTSTPNKISCSKNNQTSPFLSPILHSDQTGQKNKVINDITEDKKNSVCGSLSLLESPICILDARKNVLPEIHQIDTFFKASIVSKDLFPSSVIEESGSKSLCKFAVNKVESCHVSAGAMLNASLIVTEDVSIQLQSCKQDYKVMSDIPSLKELCGTDCELRKSKESFTCKDQKFDAVTQPYMNDSTSTVSVSGSVLSLPAYECADVNLKRQKNRWTKCEGGSLCRSDDSCAEEQGFSDVPLEGGVCEDPIRRGRLGLLDVSIEQDSCENPKTGFLGFSDISVEQNSCVDPITGGFLAFTDVSSEQDLFSGGSNECVEISGVTNRGNITTNLPSSESRNMSVALFDLWDSGNGTKLETTFGKPPENSRVVVFDQSQVSSSEVPISHSENSCIDISKHHHLHVSSVDIDESDCKYPRGKTELLCSNISKEHLFQEPSDMIVGTGELHTDSVRSLLSQEHFTVGGNLSRFKTRDS